MSIRKPLPEDVPLTENNGDSVGRSNVAKSTEKTTSSTGRSTSLRERERHYSLDKDRYQYQQPNNHQILPHSHIAVGSGSRRFSAHIVHRRESTFAERSIDAAIRRPSLAALAERGSWGNRWEFLLSCVGLSVGIGNVWRFPYLAYQNGGGAFLIPYLIMLALAGKPMYFLELAIGQFGGVGPLAMWNCCPIAQGRIIIINALIGWLACIMVITSLVSKGMHPLGVGVAMVVVSLIVCIYYNVIMSYTVYYMLASFSEVVPWSTCEHTWNNNATCYVRGQSSKHYGANTSNYANVTDVRLVDNSKLETASLQYWERHVLDLSDGIEDIGTIQWELAFCLLFSWVVVVLCLVKGIKTSGKVVYFAATFPYVILFTLLITGLMQEGAMNGVIYFIKPTWSKLLDIQVWQAAAGQMFFSLSVSMGGLIMYSSYNDFRNNVYRDALVVSVMDTVTSMISGIVTFSILGAMANELNVPIDHVVKEGPGLAFVAYPEALLRLPFPQFWSVMFFLMLFILGLDSEFALLENVLTSLSDEFAILRSHKLTFCIVTAVISYIIGLSCVTQGGNYVLTLMDAYGGGIAVLVIAIAECISLSWIYGLGRLCRDLKFMLGFIPGLYWRVTWGACAPIILLLIFMYSLIDFKPLRYKDYDYPNWADGIGWGLSCLSILQIPFWAVVNILRQDAPTLRLKLKKSMQSRESWGPADPETKRQWLEETKLHKASRVTSEDRQEQHTLKSEVVAKLCQKDSRSPNQVNGLVSKNPEEDDPQSYPGHYFSV